MPFDFSYFPEAAFTDLRKTPLSIRRSRSMWTGTIREHRRAETRLNDPNPSEINFELNSIPSVTYIDSKPLRLIHLGIEHFQSRLELTCSPGWVLTA
jgi:hypothetical protein